MKEWWINLSLRDRRFVSFGGIFIILFLIYEIFFASLSNINDSLRAEISHNQKLLTWMQTANQRMQSLQKLSEKNPATKNPAALLSLLQKQVNLSPFKTNLGLLVQSDNNSVQMNFHGVAFDNFIKWLITLTLKNNFVITQMTVTPNGAIGIVDATIFLS